MPLASSTFLDQGILRVDPQTWLVASTKTQSQPEILEWLKRYVTLGKVGFLFEYVGMLQLLSDVWWEHSKTGKRFLGRSGGGPIVRKKTLLCENLQSLEPL